MAKTYVPNDQFPIEFKYLLESYQENMTDIDQEFLNEQIANLEKYGNLLTKEEIFFISKSAIYQSVLKYRELEPPQYPSEFYQTSFLKKFEEKEKIYQQQDPFTSWLLLSSLYDLQNLSQGMKFNNLALSKTNSRKISDRDLLKIDRKFTLALYFQMKFEQETAESFKKWVRLIMKDSLKKVTQQLSLLAMASRFNVPIDADFKNLKLFSLQNAKKAKKEVKTVIPKSKSAEEIIDSVLLPKPVDDWSLEEKFNDLPKPTNDSDWTVE